MRFWNPSQKCWTNTPYMVKEYTVYSNDKRYAATVVVIAKEEKNEVKRGPHKGTMKESTAFIPMGVRIEYLPNRTVRDGFMVPGSSYFLKRKTNTLSEKSRWVMLTDRGGNVVMESHVPRMVAPGTERGDAGVPFETHRMRPIFESLVKQAWEAYEAHRAAARAAA